MQSGKTIWFTGLSASGKSTLGEMLKVVLESRGISVVLLDGDVLRQGLNRDLGFSEQDRAENLRRAGEVARILSDIGHTVIAAFITPLESVRKSLRALFAEGEFVEIFLDCPLDVCESRDPKGLYRRARKGEIKEVTGISSPFDHPSASDLVVPTGLQTPEESLDRILPFLEKQFPDLSRVPSLRSTVAAKKRRRRVAVIGLDGVPPSLVFGEAADHLPNLRALMEHGAWGPLRSTDPPITVPAWTTITTGKDPGELGIYGFRNRVRNDYSPMATVNASHVQVPRVWDYVERSGGTSILLNIPQTYPPREHNGITVSGFLTPEDSDQYTYPPHLVSELPGIAQGDYLPDVKGFRTTQKEQLLKNLYTMVERRFRVAADFVLHRPWDFFMMVEMASDRLHHAFWRYCNVDHRLYEPGNPYETVLKDFYRYLDAQVGSLLALLDDTTTVLVLSDHGARSLTGGVCINEWLVRQGYLSLLAEPDSATPLTPEMVDWSRTKVWSEGGYYARIFINVQGREPTGTVPAAEYPAFREELSEQLRMIPDEYGNLMANRVLIPEETYRVCRNVAPDLLVYFDDLARRSIGTVGHGELHVSGNDTGPDDANHDYDGILIATRMEDLRQGLRNGLKMDNASCLDITPSILNEFGIEVPKDLGGKIIGLPRSELVPASRWSSGLDNLETSDFFASNSSTARGYTPEEEEKVKERLRELGYI
jgi:adenylyl-sulfate kinase